MDVLDSRELQKRLDELENELETLIEDLKDAEEEEEEEEENDETTISDAAKHAIEEWKEENQEELDELLAMKYECDPAWKYGMAFIAEEDFEEYAQDLVSDLYGEEIRNAFWPFDCIDWEKAAASLRMDYSSIDYQGTTYLFRS